MAADTPRRKVDKLAPTNTYLGRLRERRQAVEAGDLEDAPAVFTGKKTWADLSVDEVTNNRKVTTVEETPSYQRKEE